MSSEIFPNAHWDATWQLVIDIARLLDDTKIPYVLWGEAGKKITGLPGSDKRIQFVVPDDRRGLAKDVLKNAKYYRCTPETFPGCPHTDHEGDVHYHRDEYRRFKWMRPGDVDYNMFAIFLHRKSTMLWPFPSLPRRITRGDPYYMDGTSSRAVFIDKAISISKPPTATDDKPYPIKVLTPRAYLNALMFLVIRDFGMKNLEVEHPVKNVIALRRDLLERGIVREKDIESKLLPVWKHILAEPFDSIEARVVERMCARLRVTGEWPRPPAY